MTLTTPFTEAIRAAFSGIYIQTLEPEEALAEVATLCRDQGWRMATWDLTLGLSVSGMGSDTGAVPAAADPLAAVRSLSSLSTSDTTTLLVLRGFHRFLGSAEIVQALEHQLIDGKSRQAFVVILAPVLQLPVELERRFLVLEHALPERDQLAAIARAVATEPGELPDGTAFEHLLEAAAGLTRSEAEGACALSLVRHGRVQPDVLWELKAQTLTQQGLLTLSREQGRFEQLGGLAALKVFCQRSLLRSGRQQRACRPRGVLLLGTPGVGKSAFAKALGTETERPTLILDVGALLGSLVGQTEANLRQALRSVEAMAPCILFIDEVEKALAGATGGANDSGVSARLFGTLLTWLNDHTSDVYVVATCNDISRLPPEFSRSERFDGIFFLDLPTEPERRAIWELYRAVFALDPQQPIPADAGWTGAEIRACCRLSALLDLPVQEVARQIVPVSVTAAEAVERLRTWASGRCLAADVPGLYQHHATRSDTPRRRVSREPSSN